MASKRGSLSWGAEAERRAEKLREADRPEWMPSQEQIDGYFADLRGVRVLVTGARDWNDRKSVGASLKRALKFLGSEGPERATLIHGGDTAGTDRLASSIALKMGFMIERYRGVDGPVLEGVDADILIGFVRDREQPGEFIEGWLLADRPAIICAQSELGDSVSGEFLNMQRF